MFCGTETECWSLCQPLRNDAGTWGAVAHMTSTSILFSWVAENRWRLLYSEKPDSDPEDKLRKGENTSGFSFYTPLYQNLMQLSLKITSPIALLMMGKIADFGLSAEINQKDNLRVTVAMWRSCDLQKFQKSIKTITVVIVRTIQCSLLSLRAANNGWQGERTKAGQMVILHRIFSNIKWETQTSVMQNTQSQKSNYFQSLISYFEFKTADGSTFHYY